LQQLASKVRFSITSYCKIIPLHIYSSFNVNVSIKVHVVKNDRMINELEWGTKQNKSGVI